MIYLRNTKRIGFSLFFLVFFSSAFSLHAKRVGIALEIQGKTPEQVQPMIEQTLKKLKSPYRNHPVTQGFAYRLQAKAPSIFWYGVYATSAKGGTLLRFDSYNNTSRALANVFSTDHLNAQYPKKYKRKCYTLAYFLTLIEPAFGVAYVRSNNPLTSMPVWMSASITLGVDLVLFFMGSTTFFTHKIDPFGKGLIATSVLLSAHRLYHIIDLSINIAGNNRLVKMGYTFNF